jgi:hypothetical protein
VSSDLTKLNEISNLKKGKVPIRPTSFDEN